MTARLTLPRARRVTGLLAVLAGLWMGQGAVAAGLAGWLDPQGRPTTAAVAALGVLASAADDGLDPADYRADALARQAAALRAAQGPAPAAEAEAFGSALTDAMSLYVRHLREGRVPPARVGFRVPARAPGVDPAAVVAQALDAGRIEALPLQAAPQLAQYRSLRAELARWRARAATPPPPPLPPAGKAAVRPGAAYPGLAVLHQHLQRLGDLPAEVPPPAADALYDGPWVDAVRRFQARHGLHDDAAIGRSTLEALQVPLSRRVRQIELSMERLRWLPELAGRPFLGINIPMFQLFAFDGAASDGTPVLGMKVIVGKALNTQTPVFIEDMRHLIFRPYWNVPRSIVRGEILPKLARDAGYLERQDMELVAGPADNSPVVAATPANIERLRDGSLRVRQRPGPRNALGLVKFIFPNDDAVYLHGTPAPALFDRERRDFSHGCVRVQDPTALAQWVLRDQPDWTRERIEAAMTAPRPQQVNLQAPLPVVLFYLTAVRLPGEAGMHFSTDIYRHDARLDAALAAASKR